VRLKKQVARIDDQVDGKVLPIFFNDSCTPGQTAKPGGFSPAGFDFTHHRTRIENRKFFYGTFYCAQRTDQQQTGN